MSLTCRSVNSLECIWFAAAVSAIVTVLPGAGCRNSDPPIPPQVLGQPGTRVREVPGGGEMVVADTAEMKSKDAKVPQVVISDRRIVSPTVSVSENGEQTVHVGGSFTLDSITGVAIEELAVKDLPPVVATVVHIHNGEEVICDSTIMTLAREGKRIDANASLDLPKQTPGKFVARMECVGIAVGEHEIQVP